MPIPHTVVILQQRLTGQCNYTMKKILISFFVMAASITHANTEVTLDTAIERIRIHHDSEIKLLSKDACRELRYRIQVNTGYEQSIMVKYSRLYPSKGKYLNIICLETMGKFINKNWVEVLTTEQVSLLQSQEERENSLRKNKINKELQDLL